MAPLRRVIIYIYSYIRLCTPLGVQTAKRRSTPYFTAYHMPIKYAPHAVSLIGPPGYPKTAPNGAPGGSRHKRSAGLSNLLKSRPRRPHFSNFGPPAKRGLFCKKVFRSVMGKRPGLAALVGHEGRWVTLAGLVPTCPWGTLVDLTPKYLTLAASSPRVVGTRAAKKCGRRVIFIKPYQLACYTVVLVLKERTSC